jgi:hypothetical protein
MKKDSECLVEFGRYREDSLVYRWSRYFPHELESERRSQLADVLDPSDRYNLACSSLDDAAGQLWVDSSRTLANEDFSSCCLGLVELHCSDNLAVAASAQRRNER